MSKFQHFRQLISKPLNRTVTILADGNGTNANKKLCPAIRLDFVNPSSPVPFCEVNKMNLKNYQFPILKIGYDRKDVVDHAKSGKCICLNVIVRVLIVFFFSQNFEHSWSPAWREIQ